MIGFRSAVFGNRRPESGQYFLKCFRTVHAEHLVVSGSVLHSQFFQQFLHSAVVSPFDPFPCPSFIPPTLSRFIFRTFLQHIDYQKQAAALFRREKFILLVFTFLRGKSLELAALVTLLPRLPVNNHQLSRSSLAI